MGYSKIPISSVEDLRHLLNQKIDSFLKEVKKMRDQDDSTAVDNLNEFASQCEKEVKTHLVGAADAEYQKQNEDDLSGKPISEKVNLRQEIKNSDSSSEEPITGDTILQKALCIWESMLERIKSWWKKLLDFLKETVAVLGKIANSIIEAVRKVWNWLVNLF